MPPKKNTATAGESDSKQVLVGFDEKEKTLLAAAFLSSTGPDKYDFEQMASITNYTAGTLKKFWPQVKKKAIETVPSFGTFLGLPASSTAAAPTNGATNTTDNGTVAATPKANRGRKRKVDAEVNGDNDATPKDNSTVSDGAIKKEKDVDATPSKPRGRPSKKPKADAEAGDHPKKAITGAAGATDKVQPESGDEAAPHESVNKAPEVKQEDEDITEGQDEEEI